MRQKKLNQVRFKFIYMPSITIKNITHEQRTSKQGKPFVSCKITAFSVKENKDIILSGFGSEITKTWGFGDTIDVDVNQTEQGYWNFSQNANTKPSEDKVLKLLKEINEKLNTLLGKQIADIAKDIGGKVVDGQPIATITEGNPNYVDVTKIPF